jgi:hypothetical protein
MTTLIALFLLHHLFDAVKYINALSIKNKRLDYNDLEDLKKLMPFFYDVLGLKSIENILIISNLKVL